MSTDRFQFDYDTNKIPPGQARGALLPNFQKLDGKDILTAKLTFNPDQGAITIGSLNSLWSGDFLYYNNFSDKLYIVVYVDSFGEEKPVQPLISIPNASQLNISYLGNQLMDCYKTDCISPYVKINKETGYFDLLLDKEPFILQGTRPIRGLEWMSWGILQLSSNKSFTVEIQTFIDEKKGYSNFTPNTTFFPFTVLKSIKTGQLLIPYSKD